MSPNKRLHDTARSPFYDCCKAPKDLFPIEWRAFDRCRCPPLIEAFRYSLFSWRHSRDSKNSTMRWSCSSHTSSILKKETWEIEYEVMSYTLSQHFVNFRLHSSAFRFVSKRKGKSLLIDRMPFWRLSQSWCDRLWTVELCQSES